MTGNCQRDGDKIVSTDKIFFVVHAWIEGKEKVFFDPSVIARNYDERRKLKKPWWAIAFAGYIFDYGKNGKCIPLVQRTGRDQAGKWALIPAGTSDCLKEIENPKELVDRETKEELIICEDETRVELKNAKLLTTAEIEIVNIRKNKKYLAQGELHPTPSHIFFAQVYYVKKNIDSTIFFDGELHPCGWQLDRKIALVDIAVLDGMVEPIAVFEHHKKKLKKQKIDLDESAPSLDWFRERAPYLQIS